MHTKNFHIALARLDRPQIWLACELEIDPSTVSRWVRGWVPVPSEMKLKLCELLQLKFTDLFPEVEVAER